VTDRILCCECDVHISGEMENGRLPSSQPSAAGRCTVPIEKCWEEDGGDQML
jgi:hypothetical protein